MESKRILGDKAKDLISSNPEGAIALYLEIYKSYSDQFNDWDAMYAMKALRACQKPDLVWGRKLVGVYKDEKVTSMYGWLVFDHCVKGREKADILFNEKIIEELPKISPQKDTSIANSYPCPTTICVFELADAYAENQFNAFKINELLSNIDYKLLSDRSKKIDTEKKGEIELASTREKYFALKTKSLLKLRAFSECYELSKLALSTLKSFHYNNDLWFKMRLAISLDKLGKFHESEGLFRELLSSKEGSDKWFLYRDVAEVYFENKDYQKAWKYAVDASYYGNEPHFLINLYLLQARILFKIDRPHDGRLLAELIGSILSEQGWNVKSEFKRLFEHYAIDIEKLPPLAETIKKAQLFWNSERYAKMARKKGAIISIHKNGKTGRIKDESGQIVNFHKKDILKKVKSLEDLENATVEFYEMVKEDGSMVAESIMILEDKNKPQHSEDMVGKVFDGKVKNLADYGIFVHIPKNSDGLMHKNDMPLELKEIFKDKFTIGQSLKVRVVRVSSKGINLALA